MKQRQINFIIEIHYKDGRKPKNETRNLTTDVKYYRKFVIETVEYWNLKNPDEQIILLNILPPKE
jgi:hypothetical protein